MLEGYEIFALLDDRARFQRFIASISMAGPIIPRAQRFAEFKEFRVRAIGILLLSYFENIFNFRIV